MTASNISLIERPTDLTIDWLTAALGTGPVIDFSFERIGTGQMSQCYRVTVSYADGTQGPTSVVLKVAATDTSSRQTGMALGLYEREVRFYTDVAPSLGERAVAPCYHAAFDPETGAFDLLLGDAAPAVVGDEIRGADSEHATLALVELGRLHGPLLGNAALAQAEWLNREAPVNQALMAQLYAGFVDRYGDQIAPEHREVCERLVTSFDAYLAGGDAPGNVHGLVHGDYRLDNMLFGLTGADRTLTVVDWQTVTRGPAMTDAAYFLGSALTMADRRDHYDTLVRAYHDALGPDTSITVDEVRDGIRRQSFFGVMMTIVSSMLVERTHRGDQMFMTMLQRHCAHVLDTGALETLPEPVAPEPLMPNEADDGAHPPTDEPLWNESWYFDFVDVQRRLGGWVRLGLMPNEGVAWLNVLVCGPDMPTVALVDFEAPLPEDPANVRTDNAELTTEIVEPLQTYRLATRGRGQAFDDPAAMLRGETGRAVDLTMELTWTTVGTPYQYRLTPRYEIPCTVSGTVTVDEQTYAVDGVPGQRDHSWGVRDWWAMDWVWHALHLDDGTHLHGVEVRVPDVPSIGIGYIQQPGTPLIELETVTAREVFDDNGLPVDTTLLLSPGDITATIEVRGHAPVRLTAPDGRVSSFARAWAEVTTADGRSGVGWLEWNHNKWPSGH